MLIKTHKQLIRSGLLKVDSKKLSCKVNKQIFQNILDIITAYSFKNIGLYWSIKDEPNLLDLMAKLQYHLCLPKINQQEMIFCSYQMGDEVEQAPFKGLYQPVNNYEVLPDLVIVPGLAFSVEGYRLGFGKGYYDRYFAKVFQTHNHKPVTVGVCSHEKLFEYLPFDQNDCKVCYVVTNKIIIKT